MILLLAGGGGDDGGCDCRCRCCGAAHAQTPLLALVRSEVILCESCCVDSNETFEGRLVLRTEECRILGDVGELRGDLDFVPNRLIVGREAARAFMFTAIDVVPKLPPKFPDADGGVALLAGNVPADVFAVHETQTHEHPPPIMWPTGYSSVRLAIQHIGKKPCAFRAALVQARW